MHQNVAQVNETGGRSFVAILPSFLGALHSYSGMLFVCIILLCKLEKRSPPALVGVTIPWAHGLPSK